MSKRNERMIRVIELLADGEFHSGETIGEQIGVSRTAISQYIKDIQALGLDVFRVTGKGYKLSQSIELLDEAKISTALTALSESQAPVTLQRIVGSTNDSMRARLQAGQLLKAGEVLLAEAQTAGRGRRGKSWYSPFATNLYLTMYWPLNRGMSAAMGLSILVGTVLAETIRASGVNDVSLKWPNDVLVDGKKLAGILIDLEGQAVDSAHAIIGVGVNLSMPDWLEMPIDQPWTDLQSELNNQPLLRNEWVAKFIAALRAALMEFETHGLAPFIRRWLDFDDLYQRPVNLEFGERKLQGIAQGIAADGALLVDVAGQVKAYHAGEVSLRYDPS
ncbi:bifunctional biotin--[acetyl-CoA-carboxylase] ligase/biotin operon repressor BirA [Pseudidiomarina insulisalsae]|uniref:Bifunctional ligase/repressor BirA n=1 Tax=Pseudidiomarina insulisalsae TaxID=575789 RepID=A0A432YHS4_9GAMM|nr:bifunctional biotin--[acetyl-CoA-carboxylase] ligase/biotin operon repressor BirA [Pseudidiomarina insulisalsae]RUO60470.1 bifunctional biotin--[acetyl-CoA-carboxylase] synthetase/biotin operon repressor [Pseudidiomarina insulisalsae]